MRFWKQIQKFQVETEIFRGVVRKEGSADGTRNESKFERRKCEILMVKICLKIEITTNRHYQNVDLGLIFLMEASKLQKRPSRTEQNQKNPEKKRI